MRQHPRIKLGTTKVKGEPAITVIIPGADAMVVFKDSAALAKLGQSKQTAARDLYREQNKGRKLFLPPGLKLNGART